jgi:type VI secretion system FHA domain protein
MMTIRAISLNGQPPAQPLQADFDELGGSIGRADGNALVLPDPERHISRTHATVEYRDGGYILRDLGTSSPVVLNGKPLGKGSEARLAAGDHLEIGGYSLVVMADPAAGPAAAPTRARAPQPAPRDDPLGMFGPPGADPFADLQPASKPRAATPDTIPSGFDPFADLAPRQPAPSQGVPDDLDLGLGSSQNIDQLFGLDPARAADPFGGGHPLGGPAGAGAGQGISQDPMVAIGAVRAARAVPDAQRDDAMEIRAAFIPPSVSFTGDQRSSAAPQQPAVPHPPDTNSMLFSWNAPGQNAPRGEIKTVVVPSPHQAAPEEPAAVREAPPAPAPAARAAPAATPRAATASEAELLRAFLAGAGVPDLELRGPLTPELMHTIGQLLRAATQGTQDLLLARALIKREVQAAVTMIVARENNPLKFSPSVEVALAHLLAPRGQGFMAPVAAIKDACDDLRAHQFAVMAGMRAALDGVLRRFDPVQLERRLSEKSVLDALLPMNRKSRLWDLFGELYKDLSQEAQDDFQALFGKEFLRAYEAQLDQLERDAQAGRR